MEDLFCITWHSAQGTERSCRTSAIIITATEWWWGLSQIQSSVYLMRRWKLGLGQGGCISAVYSCYLHREAMKIWLNHTF